MKEHPCGSLPGSFISQRSRAGCNSQNISRGRRMKNKTHQNPQKQHFQVVWQTDACFNMTESGHLSPNCQLCSRQLLFSIIIISTVIIYSSPDKPTCCRITSPGFQSRKAGSPHHSCPFPSVRNTNYRRNIFGINIFFCKTKLKLFSKSKFPGKDTISFQVHNAN